MIDSPTQGGDHRTFDSDLEALISTLQPICRSITGNGVRRTLDILQEHLAKASQGLSIERSEVPTGTKVFDWTVPDEWNIVDAFIEDSRGHRLVDFADCALHVLNYSEPIDRIMTFDELRPHLHSIPDQPEWIPYRTSYHNRTWGFCVAHKQIAALEAAGPLRVRIDATLVPGSLTFGEIVLRGQTSRELVLSTHICHPWMVNDNVSGMVALVTLAARLAAKPALLRHTVRMLFIPATIGSLAWMSNRPEVLERIDGGLVVTGLADQQPLTYKRSRNGNTPFDRVAVERLEASGNTVRILDWDPYGYDERQFCSPSIDLPFGRLTRGVHGKFAEYHTSADTLGFASVEQLKAAIELIEAIVSAADDLDIPRVCSGWGEPQLGRRGLYRSTGGTVDSRSTEMAYLWLLSLADGTHTLEDIHRASGLSLDAIKDARERLESVDLLAGGG